MDRIPFHKGLSIQSQLRGTLVNRANIQKRSWFGLGYCFLCRNAEEDNWHMFIKCPKVSKIWQILDATYGLQLPQFTYITNCLEWWSKQYSSWRFIPPICLSGIWRWRNNIIFNKFREIWASVMERIRSKISVQVQAGISTKKSTHTKCGPEIIYPVEFFDVASQCNICRCKFIILFSPELTYHVHWGRVKAPIERSRL